MKKVIVIIFVIFMSTFFYFEKNVLVSSSYRVTHRADTCTRLEIQH